MRNSSGRTILGKLGEALLYSEILKKGFNCYILGSQNINTLADIIIVRVETVIDPKYQGLNLILERLNTLKSNV